MATASTSAACTKTCVAPLGVLTVYHRDVDASFGRRLHATGRASNSPKAFASPASSTRKTSSGSSRCRTASRRRGSRRRREVRVRLNGSDSWLYGYASSSSLFPLLIDIHTRFLPALFSAAATPQRARDRLIARCSRCRLTRPFILVLLCRPFSLEQLDDGARRMSNGIHCKVHTASEGQLVFARPFYRVPSALDVDESIIVRQHP